MDQKRDAAVAVFSDMESADRIVREAMKALREANIDPAFSVLSMFRHGIIKECQRMESIHEEKTFLAYMEEYLEDTKSAFGMLPGQSFRD